MTFITRDLKKIIIVVTPVHFSDDKIQKYELKKFSETGYDVKIHDLTDIVYAIKRPITKNNDKRIFRYKDLKDWEKELKFLKNNYSRIIIYNFLYSYVNFQNGILFKKLSFLNAENIGFLNAGTFNMNYSSNFISYLNLRKIIHHIILNIKHYRTLSKLKKYGFIFKGFLVGSLSEYRNLYLSRLILKTKIIAGHCWDISNLYSKKDLPNFEQKNFGLLLDGAGPKFKGDEMYFKIKQAITSEKWYPRLCLLFDYLESKFNKNIIIKAHYSVEHSSNPDYFGRRRVFHDSLVELVKNSSFVISRKSTAIILAVYFKKPVVIITNNELQSNKQSIYKSSNLYQKRISKYLNCPFVNIDNYHHYKKIKLNEVKDFKRKQFLRNFGSLSNLKICNALIVIKNI